VGAYSRLGATYKYGNRSFCQQMLQMLQINSSLLPGETV